MQRCGLAFLLLFCALAAWLVSADDTKATAAADYFPLQSSKKWTYEVTRLGHASGRLTLEIVGRERVGNSTTFSLSYEDTTVPAEEGDDEPIEYTVKPGGIYCNKCGAFLLKEPLTLHSRWRSGRDSNSPLSSEVIKIDQKVVVGSVSYEHCMIVQETGAASATTTTYAPRIGPVLTEYRDSKGAVVRVERLLQVDR